MKKYLFLLIVLLFPFSVFAEETADITIKDLILTKTEGYTEVLNDVEIINNKIVLNLKMYEVEDSVEYQFMVKNNTSKDYQFNSKDFVNSNTTVEYEIIGEGNSNLIEKNHQKKFTLIVTYKNEVDRALFKAGKYDSSSKLIYELKEHHLINPETGSFFLTILFIILFVTIGFIKINNNKIRTYILLFLFLIPFSVFALEEYKIELESNIIIGYVTPNPCTYDGELVQGAEYTNGQYTYRYMQEFGRTYDSSTRTYIYEWQNIDNDGWGVHLSDPTSTDPVTTILCTSINDKPIVSMSYMFYNSKTTSIDTSSFDTNNVTNMNSVFFGCSSLTDIDVTNYNTSNVTNMEAMFFGCSSLTEINVTNFDTSNVTNMPAMFYNCNSLTNIDVTNFNTSNVTNMNSMFYGCSSLTELDLSGFDFSNYNPGSLMMNVSGGGFSSLKVLNMTGAKLPSNLYYAFGGLRTVEQIILDDLDTSLATIMSSMFNGCSSLSSLDLTGFDTSNVTRMDAMFLSCSSLTELDLSSFDTSNTINMQSMFSGCSSLTELDLSGFDLRAGSSFNSIAGSIFKGTSSLKKLNLSNMKLPVDMSHSIFRNSTSNDSPIEEINVTGWDLSNTTNAYGMFAANGSNGTGGSGLKKIVGLDTMDTSHITNMSQMFYGLSSLTTLDLSNFDTSIVTTMSEMFGGCSSLTDLDISAFNTSNVTDINSMFSNCRGLDELDLSGFDLSGVSLTSTFTNNIFQGTSSLKKLNLSNMKLPADMSHAIFRSGQLNSSPIEEIDVTGWDLSNTTNAYGMFAANGSNGLGGTGLKRIIGLDTWDTSHITNMSQMFQGLSYLTTLDLSSFNTSNVTNTNDMFKDCSLLTIGYARTQADATKFNNSSNKPSSVTFVVKT